MKNMNCIPYEVLNLVEKVEVKMFVKMFGKCLNAMFDVNLH